MLTFVANHYILFLVILVVLTVISFIRKKEKTSIVFCVGLGLYLVAMIAHLTTGENMGNLFIAGILYSFTIILYIIGIIMWLMEEYIKSL